MQVAKPKKGYKLAKWYFGKHLEIPEEWEEKKLEEIVDVFGTGDWGNDDAEVIPEDFIRVKVIRNTEFKNWQSEFGATGKLRLIEKKKLNKELLKENDILLEGSGGGPDQPVGRIVIITKDVFQNTKLPIISTNFLKRMRPKSIVNANFLNYFLKVLYNEGITKNFEIKTSNLRNFEFKWFTKTSLVPLPPLPEQKQIASILSNVDDTLQKTNQIIEQTQRLKKGMMQKLLTRGIGHTKFKKVKWLFGKEIKIPEKSKVLKIDEFLIDIKYGTSEKSNVKGVGLPLLGIPHIIGGEIQYENVEHVDLPESEIQKLKLKNDDMLFVRTNGNPNYIGRCALFQKESESYVYASYLIRMRVDKTKIFPEYLMRFLQSSLTRSQILSLARTSAGNYNINTKEIRSILVVVHENKEQKQIASILSNVDTQIQKEKLHKSNLERLKKGLMQKLLTGQIRVKVR